MKKGYIHNDTYDLVLDMVRTSQYSSFNDFAIQDKYEVIRTELVNHYQVYLTIFSDPGYEFNFTSVYMFMMDDVNLTAYDRDVIIEFFTEMFPEVIYKIDSICMETLPDYCPGS